jgi:hypothetical protein
VQLPRRHAVGHWLPAELARQHFCRLPMLMRGILSALSHRLRARLRLMLQQQPCGLLLLLCYL